jgi:glycogen synthase
MGSVPDTIFDAREAAVATGFLFSEATAEGILDAVDSRA